MISETTLQTFSLALSDDLPTEGTHFTLDDSISFQVYQIAPNLEACHAIAQRLEPELVPVVHKTPDKYKHK